MAVRHFFVLNPTAGRKDGTKTLMQAVDRLLLTEKYDFALTKCRNDAVGLAEEYIRSHSEDFVRIYACGGDGTLREVAEGMARSGSKNCALGVVPIGSGNDFVKHFRTGETLFHNLRYVTQGEHFPVDLLFVTDEDGNSRACINIMSVGFDAAVAKGMEKYKKLPFVGGSAAYNLSLAECLLRKMKNYFTILVDGEPMGDPKKPYLFAIAANGSYYGGGYNAAPYSDLSDGLMDFVRINTVSRPKFLRLVGKFKQGRHIAECGDIVMFTRCKKVSILSPMPLDVNLDGEIIPMMNPTVEVVPNRINFILPKNDAQ